MASCRPSIDLRPRGPVLPADVAPFELDYWLRRLAGWSCRVTPIVQRVESCHRCGEEIVREGFGRPTVVVRRCECLSWEKTIERTKRKRR